MNDMNKDKILQKIEVEKELLFAMPKKNQKRKAYIEQLDKDIEEYYKYKNGIEAVLKRRYNKEVKISINPQIKKLKSEIEDIESCLYLLNNNQTAYEKIGLDKIIYNIDRFYKNNLESLNQQILDSINILRKFDINVQESDYAYSIYSKEYIEVLLQENTANSEIVNAKFEELYWKCPELVIHIQVAILNIYYNNEKQIENTLEKYKKEFLRKKHKTEKQIYNRINEIKNEVEYLEETDRKILLDKFLTGKDNIKNYDEKKINDIISSIVEDNKITGQNVLKFLNSVYEYQNITEFKFIIDDIKLYYEEKEEYKKRYNENKKEIAVLEGKIAKINKKLNKRAFFKKKDEDSIINEQNELIMKINDSYKQLSLNKFYYKIYSQITEKSTIYDVLKLADSYYYYLVVCIRNKEKDFTQQEIDQKISKLHEFVQNEENTIINNITFLDNKDIRLIISDRYALMNFTINKENLSETNIQDLIKKLETIKTHYCMMQAGINAELINDLTEIRKRLKM